jgi:hypothetical protein
MMEHLLRRWKTTAGGTNDALVTVAASRPAGSTVRRGDAPPAASDLYRVASA